MKTKGNSSHISVGDRLNLGCGPNAPQGWVNLDGSWNAWFTHHQRLRRTLQRIGIIDAANQGAQWKVSPIVHDLRRPLPFQENTFSAIYASHVLEHLYRVEADGLLADCWRVLAPGGIIRLVVPDLRAMVTDYMKQANGNGNATAPGSAADGLNEKLGFRSAQPPGGNTLFRIYATWKDFHSHKWMYDSDSLHRTLKIAGFRSVAKKDFRCSDIPGIHEVEDPGRVLGGAGICLEGKKGMEKVLETREAS
jgi:SAM-dependent methyltransferase